MTRPSTRQHPLPRSLCVTGTAAVFTLVSVAAFAADRPRVAVLPLGGTAADTERERATFAIRAKLDRAGVYEPIDGPTMLELTDGQKIDYSTTKEQVVEWTSDEKPDVLIWGQMDRELKVHVLDLRTNEPPTEFSAAVDKPTDVRFAVEKLIETLPATEKFSHPSEIPVTADAEAERLWKTGPNLMTEGTFDDAGQWRALLEDKKYPPPTTDAPPGVDKVALRKEGDGRVLSMRLSTHVAEGTGLAFLSGPIAVKPGTRYRISYRYRSDGPVTRPFIKGYFMHDEAFATGQPKRKTEREIYRRQVPVGPSTGGKWVEVVDELNPQHPTFEVEFIRVDFYAYLRAGTVEFDDVVIKEVGRPTRKAEDDALDKPVVPKAPADPQPSAGADQSPAPVPPADEAKTEDGAKLPTAKSAPPAGATE